MSDDRERLKTHSRLQAITKEGKGHLVLVTQAFGAKGENLIDAKGPLFSGEPGVTVHVKQGELEEDVVLSPYFGDSAKVYSLPFVEGEKCELSAPDGAPLDTLPLTTKDGGTYFAIYISDVLKDGSLVAINDIWGNHSSKMLDEMEFMTLLIEAEGEAS